MRFAGVIISFLFLVSCTNERKNTISQSLPKIVRDRPVLLLYNTGVKLRYMKELKAHLENAFPFKFVMEASRQLPKGLISPMRKNRYRADSILRYLDKTYPNQSLKTILITHHPITCTKYMTKNGTRVVKEPRSRYLDWGIFGLGSCPGQNCVVSVNFLWARNANEKTFLQRLKNISVHELGHTFGLPHCPVKACVMNDANETIVTIDKSTGLFCVECKRKLDSN